MRKRNILLIYEHIMWGLILLLPLILWAIGNNHNSLLLSDVFSQFGLNTNNVIYNSLSDLFGFDGVLEFFVVDSSLLLYFAYFVVVEVLHIVVDVLVFIPRLAHKWMNKFTSEEVIDG